MADSAVHLRLPKPLWQITAPTHASRLRPATNTNTTVKPEPLSWNLSNSYQSLPKRFYSSGQTARFPRPEIVVFNTSLAQELGLLAMGDLDSDPKMAEIFCGNRFPSGTRPISQAYAGHQFGHFNILGDGRATLIGEQITADGKRVDIQLKGNGRTPYSRNGDGKAALAPMLREYLISEAMHALRIPTTRSLAVVTTGEYIDRGQPLAGAVLTRTAQSHIRVGTFQFAAAIGGTADVQRLADYTIRRHFPGILDEAHANPYPALLRKIIGRHAELIAQWQLTGFVHGVMNTDNMAISGETIDYGPCAFIDAYDPKTVFSTIDRNGRYRYENQPSIAEWNLFRLAETLLPLLDHRQNDAIEMAMMAVQEFKPKFTSHHTEGMRKKLGLLTREKNDEALIDRLLQLMQAYRADHANTFVRLTLEVAAAESDGLDGTDTLFSSSAFKEWKAHWRARIKAQPRSRGEIAASMTSANPFIIPRNFRVEAALEEATLQNMHPFDTLLKALQRPFSHDPAHRLYQRLPEPSTEKYRTFCGT